MRCCFVLLIAISSAEVAFSQNAYVDTALGSAISSRFPESMDSSHHLSERKTQFMSEKVHPNNPYDFLTKQVIRSNLEDSLFGAEGISEGHVVIPSDSDEPFVGVATRATSPYRDTFLPLEQQDPIAGYSGSAIVSFEDFVNVDLFHTHEDVEQLALMVKVHGELKTNQSQFGAATARIAYSIDWGSRSEGDTIQSPSNTVGEWSYPISRQVVMSGFNIISRMRMRIYAFAYASTNNANGHAAFAAADFGNTFTIEGLIPYDAAGNVLPSHYLKYTTDSGFTYPVLGVPEPSAALLLVVGILLMGCSRRR
jgi:hypothetical protein